MGGWFNLKINSVMTKKYGYKNLILYGLLVPQETPHSNAWWSPTVRQRSRPAQTSGVTRDSTLGWSLTSVLSVIMPVPSSVSWEPFTLWCFVVVVIEMLLSLGVWILYILFLCFQVSCHSFQLIWPYTWNWITSKAQSSAVPSVNFWATAVSNSRTTKSHMPVSAMLSIIV